jgi:tetratricopeptide (TPR) repeat protein
MFALELDFTAERYPMPCVSSRHSFGFSFRVACAAVVGLWLLAGLGCATGPKGKYSEREMRQEVARRVPDLRPAEVHVPYSVTPELVARAREVTGGKAGSHNRAVALINSVSEKGAFGVEYRDVPTTTATEAAELGYGNCYSLAALVVGLGRAIGLDVVFVDASDRIEERRQAIDAVVSESHMTAAVRTRAGYVVLDFGGLLSSYRTMRRVGDLRAVAQYYSNRGYEVVDESRARGEAPDWEQAARHFEIAVHIDASFTGAWSNLGVAYAKLGRDDDALEHYRIAVSIDPKLASPHNNMGVLYLRHGELDLAIQAFERSTELAPDNPFGHYYLGLALHRRGDDERAVEALERAASLRPDYREPRDLLLQIGAGAETPTPSPGTSR